MHFPSSTPPPLKAPGFLSNHLKSLGVKGIAFLLATTMVGGFFLKSHVNEAIARMDKEMAPMVQVCDQFFGSARKGDLEAA